MDGITLAAEIIRKRDKGSLDVSQMDVILAETVMALKRHLDELALRVGDVSKTMSGTYNDKRVSVDKRKMRLARDVATLNIVNQPTYPDYRTDSEDPE